MERRKPKYNPEGYHQPIKEIEPGTLVEIYTSEKAHATRDMVRVERVVETKQKGNPVVETTSGNYGGGTSVLPLPDDSWQCLNSLS